ncbi:hypothetical protein PZ895_04370 [Mesorhizobium sp. YIM 152430]|uniref:hypothetical protein n=1 Tax=Hyphomicrobiales TaxID=356 RepID=UPI00137584B0|nr:MULTISPECIES: hypothetical protein [Hyphomicrobiales]MCO6389983.1 hypothetical protein [Aliihoeflea aestuarii]MDF1599015.1 hypothetical protein [Mesorhizobium sp. YIM 152430]
MHDERGLNARAPASIERRGAMSRGTSLDPALNLMLPEHVWALSSSTPNPTKEEDMK